MRLIRFVTLSSLVFFANVFCEEGMYPISEINKLNIKELKIGMDQIFNPDGTSLIDAIVNVSGCTGSFVSGHGLILTNHHCAFRAANQASDPEHDYIKNGFLATNKSREIPARGYTARVTDSYSDVSSQVLSALDDTMSFAHQEKAIEQRMKEIVAEAEKNNPGKRAEVSEMFRGKSYVLFIYTYLRDIRLVYIPPRSIGEFGGEEDNWEWPRHTGDFSFMRAYVAPDGSPADYSSENVPFEPKKFLKVNPDGLNENDFVFILGYPGRTFRHRSAAFLSFDEEFQLPTTVEWYNWLIELMEKNSVDNRSVALKHLSRIKSLANVEKRSRGKLQGLWRLELVNKKMEEETKLQAFIDSEPQRKEKYDNVLKEISDVYAQMRKTAVKDRLLYWLTRDVYALDIAEKLLKTSEERRKADLDRDPAYMDRNFSRLQNSVFSELENFYAPTDKAVFQELLNRFSNLPQMQQVSQFDELTAGKSATDVNALISQMYAGSKLTDSAYVAAAFKMDKDELLALKDPFIELISKLQPVYEANKKQNREFDGALTRLEPLLNEASSEFLKTSFVPDANSTLRFTYGHIRGYSPVDAVYKSPITTLRGILQKTTQNEPYNSPAVLISLIKKGDFGRFKNTNLNSVPVNILYDMDTTGGNSGSPVMNARGELVGVNFDRAFEATINDYAWSESYSRSIGVDIRYVLWITQKFAKADYLLKEMDVD